MVAVWFEKVMKRKKGILGFGKRGTLTKTQNRGGLGEKMKRQCAEGEKGGGAIREKRKKKFRGRGYQGGKEAV